MSYFLPLCISMPPNIASGSHRSFRLPKAQATQILQPHAKAAASAHPLYRVGFARASECRLVYVFVSTRVRVFGLVCVSLFGSSFHLLL